MVEFSGFPQPSVQFALLFGILGYALRLAPSLLGRGLGVRGRRGNPGDGVAGDFCAFSSGKACQGQAEVLTGDGCLLIMGRESWLEREVVGGREKGAAGPKLWAFWDLFGIQKLERRLLYEAGSCGLYGSCGFWV